jgi:hypothetical protein
MHSVKYKILGGLYMHYHSFYGTTTFDNGHTHQYDGYTSEDPDTPGHIHTMSGVTTYDDGHEHYYSAQTGPSIMLPDGSHYHQYSANVDYANNHTHGISGSTSTGL